MEWRTITLIIAAGAAACGGSQHAPMDTAHIAGDAMHGTHVQHDARPLRMSDMNPCGALEMLQEGYALPDEDLRDVSERCDAQRQREADEAYKRQAHEAAEYIALASQRAAEEENARTRAYVDTINAQAEREMHAPRFVAQELVRALQQHAGSPERLRIALLPVSCGTSAPPDTCTVAHDRMETALGTDPDVVLVERQRMKDILREQVFQLTDFVDSDTAVEFGRLVGATHLVQLTVAHAAMDAHLYDITARGRSVTTGRVAVAHARYRP